MPLDVRYGNEPEAFTRTGADRRGMGRLGSPRVPRHHRACASCSAGRIAAIALLDSLALVRRHDHCWLTDHARLAAL